MSVFYCYCDREYDPNVFAVALIVEEHTDESVSLEHVDVESRPVCDPAALSGVPRFWVVDNGILRLKNDTEFLADETDGWSPRHVFNPPDPVE